jgi:muramoyltetrapeptide carboxypeptidase
MIKPPPLQKGDLIGIAAPASPFDRIEFEKGVQTLQNLGFQVRFRDDIFSSHRYLAGEDCRRIDELMGYFTDPKVKAIVFARGGYGTMRILPRLDFDRIARTPKIVIGYSDMTPLLIYLHQHFSWAVFHGPVVAKGMGDQFKNRGKNSLLHALTKPTSLGEVKNEGLAYLKKGKANAPLIGGCLSMIIANLKTPYEIDTEGVILFLEDVNEKPYKIDRMLTQLRLAGKFEGVKGLVFGPFQNHGGSPKEVEEVILDVLADLKIPIVFGFPSGHMDDMMTIPMGVEVELDSEKNSVNFLEGALLS